MCCVKMGHIQLKVRDLDRAISFYTKLLGMTLIEQVGDQYAFLGDEDDHLALVLQSVGTRAPIPLPYMTGLYHIAFKVSNRATFADVYQSLTAAGIPVATIDHHISWAIYFNDPDDNGLAIFCDTSLPPEERGMWRGRNLPLTAEKILSAGQLQSSHG